MIKKEYIFIFLLISQVLHGIFHMGGCHAAEAACGCSHEDEQKIEAPHNHDDFGCSCEFLGTATGVLLENDYSFKTFYQTLDYGSSLESNHLYLNLFVFLRGPPVC